MAKVSAPFLSLGASGTVAGTLTASRWKGIKTMRQKSEPANPNTAKQQAQRGKMRNAVSFWRFIIVAAAMKLGWNVTASLSGKPQSGFNSFTALAIKAQALDADAPMCKSVSVPTTTHDEVDINMNVAKISDGGYYEANGNCGVLKFGAAPDQLIHSATIAGGGDDVIQVVNLDTGMASGDTLYYQASFTISGQSIPITGIMSVELT